MDRLTNGPRNRAIICHTDKLVAEDLRQLLLVAGATKVVVADDLADASVGLDGIAIVQGSALATLEAASVQAWLRVGTPVVVLDGGSIAADMPAGILSKRGCA